MELVIVILIVIYVFSIIFIKKYSRNVIMQERRAHEQELSELRQEYASNVQSKQRQYEALQSQINPHFLYNTLDSIRGEALMAGNNSVADMTEHLSRFFRYCISNKGNIVTIREEISNILDYFYIQKFRFGAKFELKTDIQESCYQFALPKMTLQPIVENAIFHGLEKKKDGGVVTITIHETLETIRIYISDDGVGMEKEELDRLNAKLRGEKSIQELSELQENNTGIALVNVNARIKLHFGGEYGMTVRSTKHIGTDVEIVIPKEKYDE